MINDCASRMFHGAALARWQAAAVDIGIVALLNNAQSLGVIVPHGDDETLGCGGLIALAAACGVAVTITVLTDGAASHPGSRAWPPARLAAVRRTEVLAAAALLTGGACRVVFAGAPDGDLAGHPQTAALVPPADLYVTCWHGDPHPDHRAAFAIARAAATSAPLLAFPLWVLTTPAAVPALPLLRLDVTAHLAAKRAALAEHRSQLGALVTDVTGFVVDAALQALFVRADELYLRCPADAADPAYF